MQEKSKELLQDYDITLPLSAIYELNIKELKVLATLININDNGLNIIWDISDLLIYINYSKQAISKIINKLISLNYVEIFKHSLYGNIYRVKRRKTLIDTEESFIKNPSNKRNFSTRIKLKKMIQQNNICASCKSKLDETCQADHIIPYSKGGKTVEDNCQVLCRKCNASKGNRDE
jgi:DNA-binding MarR family transcriptional regulator